MMMATALCPLTVFFLKSAPGAFEIEILLCFLTLQSAPPLCCRWAVIQATKMVNLNQNGDIHCISVWKSLKMAHCVVLSHHFTKYICPNLFEKCNTKKKRGALFGGGTLNGENTVVFFFTFVYSSNDVILLKTDLRNWSNSCSAPDGILDWGRVNISFRNIQI